MDLIVAILLSWPIKTILWIFPLIVVIYCAHREGYKKALILLLSMIISACFSWIHQWSLRLFLEQGSIFLIAATIIVLDLVFRNRSKVKSEDIDAKKESEDDTFY